MSEACKMKLTAANDHTTKLVCVLNDPTLSFEAKGIYVHLNQTFRGNEEIELKYICEQQPDQTEDAIWRVVNSLRELSAAGYIEAID